MRVSLHPHEEARRKAWVAFVAGSLSVAETIEKRINGTSVAQSKVEQRALWLADALLQEYDKRFKAPWEDDYEPS